MTWLEVDEGAQHSVDELLEQDGEMSEHGEEGEEISGAFEAEISFIDAQVQKNLKRYIMKRAEELAIFRMRLEMEPLIPQNLTDEQLILYIFTAKYNIAAAVTLIRSNYKLRSMLPQIFSSRKITAQSMADVWRALRVAPLPVKTADQVHVCYIGLRLEFQPEAFDAHSAVKLLMMCADVYHILEGIPCSIVMILDGHGTSYGYFTQKNYEYLKIVIKYVQESMPFNVDAVYVINSNGLIRAVFKFIKPFLTKDIIRAIFFLKTPHELTRVLPVEVLPQSLGGTCPGTIDQYQNNFREKVEEMQNFFDMEEEQRIAHYVKP